MESIEVVDEVSNRCTENRAGLLTPSCTQVSWKEASQFKRVFSGVEWDRNVWKPSGWHSGHTGLRLCGEKS